LSHGAPGLRLIPPCGKLYNSANSLVLRHELLSVPFWHANSQSLRLSMFGINCDVKKHSVIFHNKQIEPEHSPLIQSWVPNKNIDIDC